MNPDPHTPTDDYDSPWKEVLEHAFPEFMAFYFPEAHAAIDWSKGYSFKNTELRQVVRDAELGKRFADALVQVTLLDGTEGWVYIHIEVQGEAESQFPKRIYTYNYRLFDRYDRPIASFAVLADQNEHWRPNHFGYDILGCRHRLDFPIAKLLDYAAQADTLEDHINPFALVTLAHLRTRQTRHDPEARYQAKRTLVRLLYKRGWERQRILDLFAVLDWMMRLPDGLEAKLWQDIDQIEGETQMRYVTSIERLATERGLQKGMQQGIEQGMQKEALAILERLLSKRFGPLSPEIHTRLKSATLEQLNHWADRILDVPTLAALFDEH
jgi:hypothetical protein